MFVSLDGDLERKSFKRWKGVGLCNHNSDLFQHRTEEVGTRTRASLQDGRLGLSKLFLAIWGKAALQNQQFPGVILVQDQVGSCDSVQSQANFL